MAKGLTKRSEDYSLWYNELVKKADLAENSPVRGCMVIKPYGFSIWENMQAAIDKMFKDTARHYHHPLLPRLFFSSRGTAVLQQIGLLAMKLSHFSEALE